MKEKNKMRPQKLQGSCARFLFSSCDLAPRLSLSLYIYIYIHIYKHGHSNVLFRNYEWEKPVIVETGRVWYSREDRDEEARAEKATNVGSGIDFQKRLGRSRKRV